MTIRRGTVADLAELRRLYTALVEEQQRVHRASYPGVDDEELDQFTLAMVQAFQHPAFAVWFAGDAHAVGFVGGSIETRGIGRPHRFGYVHWLYVEPAVRRHGIGKALAAAIGQWYADEQVTAVETHASAGDTQWEKRGWTALRTHLVTSTPELLAWATHGPPTEAPPLEAAAKIASIATPKKRKRRRRKAVARPNGGTLHDAG